MRVWIAGGTGLIGSALSASLRQVGHQVGIISRNPSRVNPEYRSVSWGEEELANALSGSDAVINLAGESLAGSNPLQMRWTEKRKARIIGSRVSGGNALQRAIAESPNPPGTFIQASAIGYYGNTGEEPAFESSPPGDDFLARICLDWEGSTSGIDALGLRLVVLRIGLVLSQKGGLLPLLALPHRLFLGGPLGNGAQQMSWIHIDDVVQTIRFLLETPQLQGAFNLTAPTPVSNRDFSNQLGMAIGKPSWFPVPAFALKLLLGEAATLALDGRPVYPQRLEDAGYRFLFPELSSALTDLLG